MTTVSGQRTRGRLGLGLLAGIPVLIAILATLGALTEIVDAGLPVVPWQTLWGLPLDRWLRDLAAALTLGFVVVGGLLFDRPAPRLVRSASLWALVWLVALLSQVPLTVSELLGRPLTDSFDVTVMVSLLTQTQLGQLLIAQIVCVGLIALLGWAILGRVTGGIVLALAIAAASLPALSGHSGLHSGHTSASISLAVHLVAVGVWIGGLVAVCIYVAGAPSDAARAIRRFSVVALVCVIALAESGLLNASLRVDGVASLITTAYGTLLLAKATLLAALVVLGWRQRRRVVPIADSVTGQHLLVRFAAFEVVLMGVALGLSVALSRTAPPAGAIAGDRITAGSLAVLSLAIPLVAVWAGARPALLRRWTSTYPEPFGVLVVVATFVMAALVPSGVLSIALAAIISSLILVAVGWMWAVAAVGPRGAVTVGIVMVGWPIVLWWSSRSDPVETNWQVLLAIVAGEACAGLLLVVRRRSMDRPDVVPDDAAGNRVGGEVSEQLPTARVP